MRAPGQLPNWYFGTVRSPLYRADTAWQPLQHLLEFGLIGLLVFGHLLWSTWYVRNKRCLRVCRMRHVMCSLHKCVSFMFLFFLHVFCFTISFFVENSS